MTPCDSLKPRVCETCRQKNDLLLCPGCQIVYYCGRNHQMADGAHHKRACKAVKKARHLYEREEQALRDRPPDEFVPGNAFQVAVGNFGSLYDTRKYMRARHDFAFAILDHFGRSGGRIDAVETALNHLWDMLRLSENDDMAVRYTVITLCIRLGRDQEAYDLVKWWCIYGASSTRYDWACPDLPKFQIIDADMLESLDELFWVECPESELMFIILLIKVRRTLDLLALQNAAHALVGVVPEKVLGQVRLGLASTTIMSQPDILHASVEQTHKLIENMKAQVRQIHEMLNVSDPYVLPSLLDQGHGAIDVESSDVHVRLRDEFKYVYDAWSETPGALEVLRALQYGRAELSA